ncbi:tyrosine--tRNA ligase [Streptomyces sp. NRRL S-31]|uniref:tyrosine--tRNA ligase n=1 Tax=Streptomyces sp. NRRL S-31 TaxID=1463898 RepID=UPI0006999AA3|nr:tyrosine--tRNA ligase [Streptomyces sp. NRRL S-31]
MPELDRSMARVLALLRGGGDIRDVLAVTTERRGLDLSDLAPEAQAALLAERTAALEPSPAALAARITDAAATGRPLVAKFTVEPFGRDFHLGNTVPLLVLDRLRRMGHQVVFVLGTVTAKVGDASGGVTHASRATDDELLGNFAAYRAQVAPFVDFDAVRVRHNADWLAHVPLPRLLALTSQVPTSLWRDAAPTTVAQLLYAVAKTIDSMEIGADVEVGGTYLTDAMAVCRHVMAAEGTEPEITLATPLIHGIDGETLMSASRGNHVPLSAPPHEVFALLSALPHRLVPSYLRALTEWRDAEIDVAAHRLTPVALRALAAADITAALHGPEAALHAWEAHRDATEDNISAFC